MAASKISVLEGVGWIALAVAFVHFLFTNTLRTDIAGFVGGLLGGLLFDPRFSVLLLCLLVVRARRRKRVLS